MGGRLGKKRLYVVEDDPNVQSAEGPGTEMEEPSSGNGLSKMGAQAPQEKEDASSSQVLLEGNRPEQGEAASITEECKSADSPVDMGSITDQTGEMATAGSGLEPPTDPYLCINNETVAAAPEEAAGEDPMLTPPPSPPSEQ